MQSKFVKACWCVVLAGASWAGWILRDVAQVGPLTTLAPYALTVERARLEPEALQESGIPTVLGVLVEIHHLLDQEFSMARQALNDRLAVEVKLADAASGAQEDASHLLNVGETVTMLGDLDRCEFELRRAAALAAQLVIDTGESAALRVSTEVFDDFDAHVAAASRLLSRLERANLGAQRAWGEWAQRLEDGRGQLRVRYGVAADRARSGSIDSELERRQIDSVDLERIGAEELLKWRQK